ncbi:MAG: cofactor-independent phosphoglycerate mutase [Coriobacteriia bacterium]|nr:cofactor-independent phosphoglycerate mutase [Coriobacteriia bacterium]
MKHVILILDGAAGWPLAELGSRTTLAAARTPNLDALAAAGMVGLAQTVPPGAEPSSSAACTSILGYDPVADYVGRGAIEAASLGISLAPDEIALRMNLVHIADGTMASYSCGHIRTEESRALVAEIAAELEDATFRFFPGVAYRHILVVKGHPELLDLVYTPPHDISDQSAEGRAPSGDGARTLLDLMERARGVLGSSATNAARIARGDVPATDIWPFWPGAAPGGLVPFAEKRGISAALTSGVDLLNGLAVLFGIERLAIPGVTDGADNDYSAQIAGALGALDDHDLVVVHVESPDEEGHAGSAEGKIEAIEAIDREMVSVLRDRLGELRILAMPDHPTPIELKTHVGEPVPFVMAGPGVALNAATEFHETAAAATGFVVDPGRGVVDLLLG